VFAAAALATLWLNNASAQDWTPLWSTMTLPSASGATAATSAGNDVFFTNGSQVDIYNTSTSVWSSATLSQGPYLSVTSVGDQVFFGGGLFTATGGSHSNEVDIYDTSAGTWSTATLSQGRYLLAATSAAGNVFFAGGAVPPAGGGPDIPSNVVDIYNTSTGTWSTATLSTARDNLAATSAGNQVFFAGGDPNNALDPSSVVDIYNTSTGTWSTAALSQARTFIAATSAGNQVFFAGGGWATSSAATYSNVVDIYNTSTGTWSTAALSQARGLLSAASVGNEVLFAGGFNNSLNPSNVVDIYNTSTGSWSTATLSQARYLLTAAAVGNQVFFAGGWTSSGLSNVVDIYTLQNYGTITSSKAFTLGDQTTVTGLMQLNAPGSLTLATFNLNVGSMSGNAPIDLGSQTLTVGSDNTSNTYSGIISDAGALVKTGSGTLVLTAMNTFTGPTTVSQGKLLVGGALGNSPVSVNGGGGLGGTGSIAGQVTLAGGSTPAAQGTLDLVDGAVGTLTFSDTNSADTVLTIGGPAVANPSILNFEVGSAADLLVLSAGKLVVNPGGGLINIIPLEGFGPGTYDLIDFTAGQASGLNNLLLDTPTINGYSAYLQPTATAEELVVTPEPSTVALLAASAIGLIGYGLRKQRMARRTAKPAAFDHDDDPPILSCPSRSFPVNVVRRPA
jgi:autotransporter-associated beta strand protein